MNDFLTKRVIEMALGVAIGITLSFLFYIVYELATDFDGALAWLLVTIAVVIFLGACWSVGWGILGRNHRRL